MNSKILGSKTILPTFQEFIERKIFLKKQLIGIVEEEILELRKELVKINEQEIQFPLFKLAD